MKVTNIEQQENIFIITKTPNLIQRIFGVKDKIEKYKDTGSVYEYFGYVRAYSNQEGKILGATHKMTKVIENWRRSF